MNNPRFPLYIPTKGRHDIRMTSDCLSVMKVPHNLVVEPQEVDLYKQATEGNPYASVIELDMTYKERYELCDDLGLTKSTGPGPARNFIWDHSIQAGYEWHWVMDDNIRWFGRFNDNQQIICNNGTPFFVMEEFCLRYINIAMAGPNYEMFVPNKKKHPPFILNTRIYSCNLIRNDVPFRWRGRYNEDTILSLDMITKGWCTVQFNIFLQKKIQTQVIKGGNTAEFYAKEGTRPKSEMLAREYPQYTKVVMKYGRVHHSINYKPFQRNKLILKPDVKVPNRINEFGLKLVKVA